jgi:hypothetical protein
VRAARNDEGLPARDRRRRPRTTPFALPVLLGRPGARRAGRFTLQLVLDQGTWEEIVTVSAEDAEVLQGLLRKQKDVVYDVGRRVLMFGTTPVGQS